MTDEGCPIPQLDQAGRRILELRGLLVGLQPTVDPGTVCRIFGADLDDLRLLAVVETILKENQPEESDAHGEGH